MSGTALPPLWDWANVLLLPDKDAIPDKMIKQLRKYIENPDFVPVLHPLVRDDQYRPGAFWGGTGTLVHSETVLVQSECASGRGRGGEGVWY